VDEHPSHLTGYPLVRTDRRERLQIAVPVIGAVLLCAMLVARFHERRAPWFERPETILDHVGPEEHQARYTLILLEKVRPLLPKGAYVTCFQPLNGKQHDDSANYLPAVGMLPDQIVLPAFTASDDSDPPIDYVVAVGEPFVHARYTRVAEFPEGALYRASR
jgi:hypothetical protein